MAESNSEKQMFYLSWPAMSLVTGEPFPGNVYLCIGHRMVRYRNEGDSLLPEDFDKLVLNKVRYVFIEEDQKDAFSKWAQSVEEKSEQDALKNADVEQKEVIQPVIELRRAALDLFSSPGGDEPSKKAIAAAKKMVTEFLRRPFVINNISQIQKYNKGCVDHSVNVAVLSVFLGLRMGYSSQVILEHLALGGLLHDLGKTLLNMPNLPADQFVDENDPIFQQHPELGKGAIEASNEIANEVRMIVVQHHEYLDGSGFPHQLKGLAIYDLARLVAIANVFDNLVSRSRDLDLKKRISDALKTLETDYSEKLDPRKLEKSIKIISYSLA